MATYNYYYLAQTGLNPNEKIVINKVNQDHIEKCDGYEYVSVNSEINYSYNKKNRIIKVEVLKASRILEVYNTTSNKILKSLLELMAAERSYILDIDVKPLPPKGSFSKSPLLDKRKRLASVDIISRAERRGL